MKFKKIVPIILSVSILLGGCSSFSSVQKDKVMVEKTNDQENDAKISKQEAKEIASDYLKKCYNIDSDLENLETKVVFSKKRKDTPNGAWRVYWENNKTHGYYGGLIDAKDGRLLELIDYRETSTLKETREIAFNFLKNNKLAEDMNNLRLLNFNEVQFDIVNYDFSYGEDEFIMVSVDKNKNKVIRFNRSIDSSFKTDDKSVKIKKEKAIEIALDGIEKYFNAKVDRKKLVEDISLHKETKLSDGSFAPANWNIDWRDLNAKEENKDITYSAYIDANNGELREVGAVNIDLNQNSTKKISDKEMEEIALDFIEKSKFISNIKDLGSPYIERWENYGHERGMVGFKYNDEMLWVYIDFTNKKVDYIGYGLKGK